MAKIFGSWMFVSFIIIFMGFWIALNIYLYETRRWDPYPFILLNLILSCVAAIQTPIILMSQNREAERDRIKYEKDHYVNYKAEKLIEHVHSDVQEIKKVLR
jgi:uncharacterized membrane protein